MKKKLLLLSSAALALVLSGCSRIGYTSYNPSTSQPTPTTSSSTPTPTTSSSTPTPTTSSSTTSSEPTSTTSSSSSSWTTSHIDPTEDDKVHVIILAGQSGARGKGLNKDLTTEQAAEMSNVQIFADGYTMPALSNIPEHIGDVEFKNVKGGFGDSGSENGPEIGIAENLATRYPGRAVVVKFTACGSEFKTHWYSSSMIADNSVKTKLDLTQKRTSSLTGKETGPLTNNLYEIIDQCKSDLAGQGKQVSFDGIVWSHGEMDAKDDDFGPLYKKNLNYFIDDLRDFLKDDDIPFVITGAYTNSAKYSNTIKQAQIEVANEGHNVKWVTPQGLNTNTFEPWHYGAQSNIIVGQRAAAEILALKDTRVVSTIVTEPVYVPFGTKIELPHYLECEYDDGSQGMSKVIYLDEYNENQEGVQDLRFIVDTPYSTAFEGVYQVEVAKNPYVDGVVNESSSYKQINISGQDNSVSLYTQATDLGIYFGGVITDTDIWSDAENWEVGDMGQMNDNDDFRIYINTTEGGANDYTTAAISSAGLLRYYAGGTDMHVTGQTFNELKNKNLVYKKTMEGDFAYRSTTIGTVNDKNGTSSVSWSFELYLSYEALGVDGKDDLVVCFVHSDISNPSGATWGSGSRTNTEKEIVNAAKSTTYPEKDKNCYYTYSSFFA